jgi:hypothetical protein
MADCHLVLTPEQVAEDTMAYTPLRPGGVREALAGATVTDQGMPHRFMRTAACLRFADPEEGIAAVRRWFAARGGLPFTWWLGPHSAPADLAARLLARGARRDDEHGGTGTALVLDRPPSAPPGGDGTSIREVDTFEDYAAMQRIVGMHAEEQLPGMWDDWRRRRHEVRAYAAVIDGRPVADLTILVDGED